MIPQLVTPLWRIADVAEYLDVPVRTVYRWSSEGTGPRSIKVGKHLRYRREDVDRWLDARSGTTSPSTPADGRPVPA